MSLLILGANSDVAYELALQFAANSKKQIMLASRDLKILEKKAKDIEIRHNVSVQTVAFDAADIESHAAFYQNLPAKPDVVIVAFGYLGDQTRARSDFKEAQKIINNNFTGAVSILEIIAADFEDRGSGLIIGISSVAGERGRQSNYFYGAAKGALSIYLSGLRNRLCKNHVHVMTVLPGFIDTKMTRNLKLPAPLTSTAKQAAREIYEGCRKTKNIIYIRWFWRPIMTLIKAIPETIFKRLAL